MKKAILTTIFLFNLLFQMLPLLAQKIENEQKAEVLKNVILELNKSYIDESKAIEMADYLNENIWNGNYDSIENAVEFAFVLTRDMRSVSKDLHLELFYSDQPLESESTAVNDETYLKDLLANNGHGVRQKKILAGNIGYLEIPFFGPITHCADSLFKAMDFVKDTKALIIDLRECRGSMDPDMIPLFSGYFFDKPVHLFDFENRAKQSTKQMWSAAYVPGKKYLDKPVYILTSGRTFSGGEEFAYDMKHLKRATVIGQVTKGGANPKFPVQLAENFIMTIPMERSVNAITKTNWEQVGVQPDIPVNSSLALSESQILAVKDILSKSKDKVEQEKLEELLVEVERDKPQLKRVSIRLNGFSDSKEIAIAGTFNYWAPNSDFLVKNDDEWVAVLEMEPGKHAYKFVVDGRWILDPNNPKTVEVDGHVNSELLVQLD